MKQKGHEIIGDVVKVDSYTCAWDQVKLHPSIFYRRYDEFSKSFRAVKGFYAELDLGQYVSIRFSEKADITKFYEIHKEYL